MAHFLTEAAAQIEELLAALHAREDFGVVPGVLDAEVEKAIHADAWIGMLGSVNMRWQLF